MGFNSVFKGLIQRGNIPPNITVRCIAQQLLVWEVHGLNLSPDTNYSEKIFVVALGRSKRG
jgi:hypothetical protein